MCDTYNVVVWFPALLRHTLICHKSILHGKPSGSVWTQRSYSWAIAYAKGNQERLLALRSIICVHVFTQSERDRMYQMT